MNVQVGNGFTAILAVVDDQAIATVGNAFLAGDLGSNRQKVAQGGSVFDRGFPNTGNGLGGDHQDVGGCLRGDVAEGDAEVVTMDDIGRDLLVADLLKTRVFSAISRYNAW